MQTDLDRDINRVTDAVTADGQMFALKTVTRRGVDMPAFVNAPPSLAHYFAHFCNQNKEALFLVDGDQRLTFGEVYTAAGKVAHGLATRHGVKKGDRVGIAARNSAQWAIAYMGTIMAGGCATLLNGWWTGEELAYGIDLCECSLVLADAPRAARLDGIEHGASIVVFDHDEAGLAPITGDGDTAMRMLGELGPDDLATILYTSGSTGNPKGAFSDHLGVVSGTMNYICQTAMILQLLTERGEAPTVQPSALVSVPLFHVTGEIPVFLQSIAIGRKLVLMPKWDAGEALRLLDEEKVTYFVGVPLMSYEMATHPDRDQFDLSQCKSFAAGGAPRPVEHVNKIKESFPNGFPLLGYGLTETNAIGAGNLNENYLAKPGSTGMASRPLVDMAILDDAGKALPQGEVGEISIRSTANFLGYWKDEEATKAAYTDDAYFRTGDLGYLDPEGYLYIVDRKKDIIIRGGENIACIEVEDAIYAHPAVAECSVFGLPDERMGEVPAAVYLTQPGESLSPDDLKSYLAEHIAHFKIPEKLWQAEEQLPRLGTQKVDKRAVKALYAKDSAAA
ncbi:AMP-dependent synthetase [Erythrobacter sp. HI0063]|jgi:acyl-CoA synthetase (AMP-forming)/AMP-acid ligase II|uniref:class I adenylate-forming enzyme family protein n=1 Tax=Erythrobacter sp. HI0063 TaxID=1822240 RepID=UPI0007C3D7CF|nr:class I adenylate-forming enzyme family protein [Erythrobacter sp. HI0063]KZY55045.1 AMP-dependent synthetase [Erythrobacter sp. HI0063]